MKFYAYSLVFLGALTVFPLGIALAGDEPKAKTGTATHSVDTKMPPSLAPRLPDHDEPSVSTGKRLGVGYPLAPAGGDADLDEMELERAEREIAEAQEQRAQEAAQEQLQANREFVKDIMKKIEGIQREETGQIRALDGIDP